MSSCASEYTDLRGNRFHYKSYIKKANYVSHTDTLDQVMISQLKIEALNSLAVCQGDNAITKAKSNGATDEELRYLSSLVQQLRGKTDRFLTKRIRRIAMTAAKHTLEI